MSDSAKTPRKKAPLNKTIDFTLEEGRSYFARCTDARAFTEKMSAGGSDGSSAGDTADLFAGGADSLNGRIFCGDTFALMPHLQVKAVDLAIVDPPYNLAKEYGDMHFHAQNAEEYAAYTKHWLELLLPLLKPAATLYVCSDWKSSITIADVLTSFERQNALLLRNRITWQREKGRGAQRNWKNSMEDIWFCTIPGPESSPDSYTFNIDAVKIRRRVIAPYTNNGKPKDWVDSDAGRYRDTCPSNFWDDISVPFWSMPENTAHPAQKAEKLLAKLILASSNPGDLVFDPFLGSGSTAVTAYKLGRRYCGIEQNPQYCAWAQKRLEKASLDKSIQGFEEGIFLARNMAGC